MEPEQEGSEQARRERRLKASRHALKFRGVQVWSAEEEETCRQLYPDYDELQKRLPNRTPRAIKARCAHTLKLYPQPWGKDEKSLKAFKRVYTTGSYADLRQAYPDKTYDAIGVRARRLGLKRPRRPYKLTGYPIVDKIRALCFEIRWSAQDLDEACGTTYFVHALNRHKPNQAAIEKALKVFEGYI